MAQWHGGKGSSQRKVDKKKYNDNWDRIFKQKADNDLKFTTAEDFINSVIDGDQDDDWDCKSKDRTE
tara:strand:- start:66 stop:266 length:201 start_codon:yes stop_codon:yes gene_type:complete